MLRSTAKINDECHDQETNDREDLDTCEDKFSFSVYLDGEDIQADNEDYDDGDPYSYADVLRTFPVLDDDSCGRDFGTEGNRGGIPVLK